MPREVREAAGGSATPTATGWPLAVAPGSALDLARHAAAQPHLPPRRTRHQRSHLPALGAAAGGRGGRGAIAPAGTAHGSGLGQRGGHEHRGSSHLKSGHSRS